MYEQALGKLTPSDQEALAGQGPTGRADFTNGATDKYPARLIAGPEFWIYFRDSCHVFRVSDMESLKVVEETGRIGYNMGNTRVRQTIGMGVSIAVAYRDGTASASNYPNAKVYMENAKQLGEARALIEKFCPKAGTLWGEK